MSISSIMNEPDGVREEPPRKVRLRRPDLSSPLVVALLVGAVAMIIVTVLRPLFVRRADGKFSFGRAIGVGVVAATLTLLLTKSKGLVGKVRSVVSSM
jgi:hypothetical protein